jgi:Zn-dependent protease
MFQDELPLVGRSPESVRDWIRARRRTRWQRIRDWAWAKILRPALGALLELIQRLRFLRQVPGPVWTIGTALISIAIYSSRLGWKLSAGFITLLMVHELGHIVAARYYGIKISAPVVAPYLGALIIIREEIRDPWKQAVMGIAGPVFGTAGALVCWAVSHATGSLLFAEIAFAAMIINGVNVLPLGALDGGHVVALFHRKLWIIGYLIMAVMAWYIRAPMMILSLVIMLPMVIGVFRKPGTRRLSRGKDAFHVSLRKRLAMGALYIGLIAILAASMSLIFSEDIAPAFKAEHARSVAALGAGSPVAKK